MKRLRREEPEGGDKIPFFFYVLQKHFNFLKFSLDNTTAIRYTNKRSEEVLQTFCRKVGTVSMMEIMYELRSTSGFCRLFDFYTEATTALAELVRNGKFRQDELYINQLMTE